MFNNIEDIKKFITWAKENKLKSFKIKDIEVEISELSFIEEEKQDELKEALGDTLVDTETTDPKELEELLFWSAQK
jgi:hypothetical protein